MNKNKKCCDMAVGVFSALLLTCVQCSYADPSGPSVDINPNQLKLTRIGSSDARDVVEITDLGNGQFQAMFSVNDSINISRLSFEMNDGSNVSPALNSKTVTLDDNTIAILGNFSSYKYSTADYKSYIIREANIDGDKGKILFEEKVPELQASLRDSSEEGGKEILTLKNIYTKPISIINVLGDEDNGDKLKISELAIDKYIPVGGVYEIELQPGTCIVKDQENTNDLSVEVTYKIEGDDEEIDSIIGLSFSCKDGQSLSSVSYAVRGVNVKEVLGILGVGAVGLKTLDEGLDALIRYLSGKGPGKIKDVSSTSGDSHDPGPGPGSDKKKGPGFSGDTKPGPSSGGSAASAGSTAAKAKEKEEAEKKALAAKKAKEKEEADEDEDATDPDDNADKFVMVGKNNATGGSAGSGTSAEGLFGSFVLLPRYFGGGGSQQ